MNITIADIKAILKKKMYAYAHCNLSVNNPYYVNDGAIKNAEAWFKDFAEIKNLDAKKVESVRKHLSNLKEKYL